MMEPVTQSELESLDELIAMARDEDIGDGDITSELLDPDIVVKAEFIARQDIVFCGQPVLQRVPEAYGAEITTDNLKEDGEAVKTGGVLATWEGPVRGVMSTERVALNFIRHLSGIATLTRQYADRVAGTGARILDTRKTTPGWRELEKYAVRAGGGFNHRRGLYDAVMVKDNHLASLAARTDRTAMEMLGEKLGMLRKRLGSKGFIELEVDTIEQLKTAIELPVDIILLDNMNDDELREAVELRSAAKRDSVKFEASGSITLDKIEEIAKTGIERISVGAITHSAGCVDIGLDIVESS